jgi:hypothetical protein
MATTIRSGPIAIRDIVADTPGTTTRRQAIPGPGGIVGVDDTVGTDGEGSAADELEGATKDVEPIVASGAVGVTDPQPATMPTPARPATSTRISRRRALGRARGRLGIGQG